MNSRVSRVAGSLLTLGILAGSAMDVAADGADIGREVAVPRHLAEGEQLQLSTRELLAHGKRLFNANWTIQEGAGRPGNKGTGAVLTDPFAPLTFPRNFNRLSAPDANSCAGCHNAPFGIVGGGGDFVTNVFVQAQRFDFTTFDPLDTMPARGAVDERGIATNQQTIANSRNSLGMFGSGFIEMLARQMTFDLQRIRDTVAPGGSARLMAKGVTFGVISRSADGTWDVSAVEGLPAQSLASDGALSPPQLIIRPFHQSGSVPSLRVFTNNAFNHHHGIQSTERFGSTADPDADGVIDEMTRADVTAAVLFQATLPVPGRVIPNHPRYEAAIRRGERLFAAIGCAGCHVPTLPLDRQGWIFSEPGPFNPPGNARSGAEPVVQVDLTNPRLPAPRLRPRNGVVLVPAFTDLKLHDITSGPDDPNREPLDMNQPVGSRGFFAGNSKFLTRKLWGVANEPPYFHHGQFTTLREAVLAHEGEARDTKARFGRLRPADQDAMIEFLKSLQVLPPGTQDLIVDEDGRPRT